MALVLQLYLFFYLKKLTHLSYAWDGPKISYHIKYMCICVLQKHSEDIKNKINPPIYFNPLTPNQALTRLWALRRPLVKRMCRITKTQLGVLGIAADDPGSHRPGQQFLISLVEAEDGWSRFPLFKAGQLIQQWWLPCIFWMAQSSCSLLDENNFQFRHIVPCHYLNWSVIYPLWKYLQNTFTPKP